ncbi:hypothetical protein D3C87_2154860 [compost metagenome]
MGASDHFQVISIEDIDECDVTDKLVDVGIHFPSLNALRKVIATKLHVPVEDIELEEV